MQNISIGYFNQKKRNYKNLRSILITGTKGKTSVSLMLNYLFDFARQNTLYVSTSGVYKNNEKISTYDDSIKQFCFSPTVMPGRYIYSILKNGTKPTDFTAILESSLSCGIFGTGIHEHKVGALLNIYSDHVGNGLLHSRRDLYKMKSFIFNNLAKSGFYVANLDNDLSKFSLGEKILSKKKIHKIAFSNKNITHEQAKLIAKKFALSDLFYSFEEQIYSLNKGLFYTFEKFAYLKIFQNHQALKENLLAFLAIASIFFEKEIVGQALESFRFPFEFGRMMVFEKRETNQLIVIDYAHEPESLKLMLDNLQNVHHKKPYLITRAALHRTDQSISKLSDFICKLDIAGLTIYDLMSGSNNKKMIFDSFERKEGETAKLIATQFQKEKPKFAHRIVFKETDALREAIDAGHELILHIRGNMSSLATFIEDNGLKRLF